MTITLLINDKETRLPGPVTAQQLLEHQGLRVRFVAVVRNDALVPRARHSSEELRDGDVIHLYRVVAGG